MKSDVLKVLAQRAKNRMRSGYIETNERFADKKALRVLPKNNVKISIIDNNDDEAYRKLCSILEDDNDVINPIRQLMDEATYKKLDKSGKERYFFETAEKYSKLKRRYELEKVEKIAR